jgi:hypothetical protein
MFARVILAALYLLSYCLPSRPSSLGFSGLAGAAEWTGGGQPGWARQNAASASSPSASALDFEMFRTRIQPILLNRRKGHARCYACHSQGTPFRLQPLAPGSSSWSDEESRRNFEAVQRLVVPGDPLRSRLLTMPLATEAGGTGFHPGGKHWSSQDDPEWQTLAAWVRGERTLPGSPATEELLRERAR